MRPSRSIPLLVAVGILILATTVARATTIQRESRLLPSDPGDGDNTGISVSIDGDVAIVGSVFHDDPGIDAGAAYVYRYGGLGWNFEQKLTPADPEPEDRFGRSVSVSGDVAVIGAYRSDDAGSESGAAYVYRFDGASWIQEQKLTASDAAVGDRFGCGVSIRGDVAAIGAYRDGDLEQGSAYVFRFDGVRWNQEQKLTADQPTAYDYYGFCVSTDGDRVAVGCECDDDRGVDSGSAFLYRYNGLTWLLESKLRSADGASEDYLGHYVSLRVDACIVGAYGDDGAGSQSGSAYIFRRDGFGWVQEEKLTASDAAAGDVFGWNVSICGDLALVGAQWNTDGGTRPGASYLFRRAGATWTEEAKLAPTGAGPTALFGYAGSVCDRHVLVGAPWDSVGGVASGAAYAFDLIDPAAAELAVAVIRRPELRVEPNPASSGMRIAWIDGGRREPALVTILDATGRLIRTLHPTAAEGSIPWDGTDARGKPLPSGTYYARFCSMAGSAGAVIVLCR